MLNFLEEPCCCLYDFSRFEKLNYAVEDTPIYKKKINLVLINYFYLCHSKDILYFKELRIKKIRG